MRKNTQNVFNAWMNGRSEKKQKSVWTDSIHIYSYHTKILFTANPDCEVPYRINMYKYSVTTTVQQRGIKALLDSHSIAYSVIVIPEWLNNA